MSHYERRLEADKGNIRDAIARIGKAVASAVEEAVAALLERDVARSYAVMLGDLPINRAVRALDQSCHAFVARHLPSAGHLRFISSVMRLNVALERVGDYAVTISREAAQLQGKLPEDVRTSIKEMGEEAVSILREALTAFVEMDAALARGIRPQAKAFGRDFDAAHRALIAEKDSLRTEDLIATIGILTKLDRVSDQAKNIGEEALFAVTGETKPPKVYLVHFVDARNTMVSPLAEAIARKAYPGSGEYTSGGWRAGEKLAPEAAEVAADLGLELTGFKPQPTPTGPRDLDRFHVIVGLGPNTRQHLGELPFSTIYQEWTLPSLDGANGATRARLREIAQALSAHIGDLMVQLRGEDAP